VSWERVKAIFEHAAESRAGDALEPVVADVGELLLDEVAPSLFEGRTIGGYEIGRPLGRGGMGIVFQAEQLEPARIVALKMMRAEMSTPAAVRRFRWEGEVLGKLRHPFIAQVLKAGTFKLDSGAVLPWIAMEFVEDAAPLACYVEEHDLTLEARLRLFLDVCDAVQHGHERGRKPAVRGAAVEAGGGGFAPT